jgi:thiol-disulfide isomerase/thioredoxin
LADRALGKLAAVFVDRDRGGGGDVEAVRQARHRDLDHPIKKGEHIRLEPKPLVACHENGAALKREGKQALRTGGLLEAHELPALAAEPGEHRRQAAVHLEDHRVGSVPRDSLFEPRRAAGDDTADAKAAACSYDMREVHTAAKLGTGDDQFSVGGRRPGRPVANVFESHTAHGVVAVDGKPRADEVVLWESAARRFKEACVAEPAALRPVAPRPAGLVGCYRRSDWPHRSIAGLLVRGKGWVGSLLLLAAAGCGVGLERTPTAAGPSDQPAPVAAAVTPGKNRRVEIALVDHAELMARVAAHRGRVVVLDCWSTSCPPCIKEFPGLIAMEREFGGDVACLSLSFDYEGIDTPESVLPRVRSFLEQVGADRIENLLGRVDADALFGQLDLVSVPAIYVWGREGMLVQRFDDDDAAKRLGRAFTYDDVREVVRRAVAAPAAAANEGDANR